LRRVGHLLARDRSIELERLDDERHRVRPIGAKARAEGPLVGRYTNGLGDERRAELKDLKQARRVERPLLVPQPIGRTVKREHELIVHTPRARTVHVAHVRIEQQRRRVVAKVAEGLSFA
jgi:hypothetical protein